jgi:hypothetical protein
MITIERTDTFIAGTTMFRVTPGPWLRKRGVIFGPWCHSRRTAVLMWIANVSDCHDFHPGL